MRAAIPEIYFHFYCVSVLSLGFETQKKKCPEKEQWLNECLKIVSSITDNSRFMACKINAHIQPNAINWHRMDYGCVKSCGNYLQGFNSKSKCRNVKRNHRKYSEIDG